MAAMRRRTGKIKVTSAAGIPRGAVLQIDVGENAEYTQVLALRGNTLKVGRVRWWHRTWWWLLRQPARTGRYLRRGLCALRGHPLDGYRCKCGERERPDDDWSDWAEDLYDDDEMGWWPEADGHEQ